MLLEREERIAVRIEGTEKDMAKGINEKLFHENNKFRASLLCLLAYTSLCQCKWAHVIDYAEQFSKKKCYEVSMEDGYNVDMYKMEAFC